MLSLRSGSHRGSSNVRFQSRFHSVIHLDSSTSSLTKEECILSNALAILPPWLKESLVKLISENKTLRCPTCTESTPRGLPFITSRRREARASTAPASPKYSHGVKGNRRRHEAHMHCKISQAASAGSRSRSQTWGYVTIISGLPARLTMCYIC